jgi:hypothetical protein
VVVGETEFGVGAAVDLAEQAPILGQADGFVAVLPPRESFVLRLAAVMIGRRRAFACRARREMVVAAE